MNAAGIVVGVIYAIGLWMAVRTTERGLPDTIAGTYLVPE
jgi:uncharacterized RDD family membrane protein YckC